MNILSSGCALLYSLRPSSSLAHHGSPATLTAIAMVFWACAPTNAGMATDAAAAAPMSFNARLRPKFEYVLLGIIRSLSPVLSSRLNFPLLHALGSSALRAQGDLLL